MGCRATVPRLPLAQGRAGACRPDARRLNDEWQRSFIVRHIRGPLGALVRPAMG